MIIPSTFAADRRITNLMSAEQRVLDVADAAICEAVSRMRGDEQIRIFTIGNDCDRAVLRMPLADVSH